MKKLIYLSAVIIFAGVNLNCGKSKSEKESKSKTEEVILTDIKSQNESAEKALSEEDQMIVSNESTDKEPTKKPENPVKAISSSAAKEDTLKFKDKKFVRTADLKFRVKDAIKSTLAIEDITAANDGYVEYTNLKSNVNRTLTIPLSADSSLESTYYTISNEITVRVPNYKLDTFIRSVGKLVDYMDFRVIKAEDISFDYISKKLEQSRLKLFQKRLSKNIDTKGKKLDDINDSENNLLSKQEMVDNSFIDNLKLLDKVKYSTVHIDIYQRPSVKREVIANEKNIKRYEPGFFKKLVRSFVYGWEVCEIIVIGLVKIWFIILVIIAVLLFVFRMIKRNKNK